MTINTSMVSVGAPVSISSDDWKASTAIDKIVDGLRNYRKIYMGYGTCGLQVERSVHGIVADVDNGEGVFILTVATETINATVVKLMLDAADAYGKGEAFPKQVTFLFS